MRIGVIASIAHSLPPASYGPWEQIASTLTEGFVARGHEVTLFATENSRTSAQLFGTSPVGYEEDPSVDPRVCEALHNPAAFELAADFDVISNHFDFLPLTYSRLVATPVVTTIHGFSSPKILPIYQAYDDIGHYVSVSDTDRNPSLTYAATIHHGIALDQFTFVPTAGSYLLFLGRIHPDKGTHLAIEVAKLAGLPLIIAGPIQDEAYFSEAVQPHLGADTVSYVGPVGPVERNRLLGGAKALLHLISFAEPFGLSVIESLATGTPVIATPLGAMPELLRSGATGFLVSDVAGAVSAVAQIDGLARQDCRAEAVARFGSDRMVDDYLTLFERIVGLAPRRLVQPTQPPLSVGPSGLFSHVTF